MCICCAAEGLGSEDLITHLYNVSRRPLYFPPAAVSAPPSQCGAQPLAEQPQGYSRSQENSAGEAPSQYSGQTASRDDIGGMGKSCCQVLVAGGGAAAASPGLRDACFTSQKLHVERDHELQLLQRCGHTVGSPRSGDPITPTHGPGPCLAAAYALINNDTSRTGTATPSRQRCFCPAAVPVLLQAWHHPGRHTHGRPHCIAMALGWRAAHVGLLTEPATWAHCGKCEEEGVEEAGAVLGNCTRWCWPWYTLQSLRLDRLHVQLCCSCCCAEQVKLSTQKFCLARRNAAAGTHASRALRAIPAPTRESPVTGAGSMWNHWSCSVSRKGP